MCSSDLRLAPFTERIIAVARRGEALEQLAADLAADCEVLAVIADLRTIEGVTQCIEQMRQRGPVDCLINNAGYGTYTRFVASDVDQEMDMISLNVLAPTRLCRAAVPAMLAQGRGAIINVASVGALQPVPKSAVYAGTKSFLHNFTLSLAAELSGTGISVQSLCPGFTRTEIHDTETMAGFDAARVPDAAWMSAEDVVTSSLEQLGS